VSDEEAQPDIAEVLAKEGALILAGEVPLDSINLDVKSIDLLYDADPLRLTKAQRAVVVESERRARAEFLEKKKAKSAKKKQAPLPEEIEALTLDDLQIDVSKI
jgi:hypothetical protein